MTREEHQALLFSEWFWSQASAERAARRIEAKGGFLTRVHLASAADGRQDWLLQVFSKSNRED